MSFKRLVVLLTLLLYQTAWGSAASSDVLPASGELQFSATGTSSQGTLPVKFSGDEGTGYSFRLLPDFDIRGAPIVVELMLTPARQSPEESQNFLDPTGNAHGYQKYIFAASDFEYGIQKSTYGPIRTIDVASLHLIVEIKVLIAKIFRNAADVGGFRFDKLTLEVSVRPD